MIKLEVFLHRILLNLLYLKACNAVLYVLRNHNLKIYDEVGCMIVKKCSAVSFLSPLEL
jgi:hypothetical protein